MNNNNIIKYELKLHCWSDCDNYQASTLKYTILNTKNKHYVYLIHYIPNRYLSSILQPITSILFLLIFFDSPKKNNDNDL